MSAIQGFHADQMIIISCQVTPKLLENLTELGLVNDDGSVKGNNIILFGSPHNCKYAAAYPRVKNFIDSLKRIDAVYNVPTFGRGIVNMHHLGCLRKAFGGWILAVDEFRVRKVAELFAKNSKLFTTWLGLASTEYERNLIEEFRLFAMAIQFHIETMCARSIYTIEEHIAYMNEICGEGWYESTNGCDSTKIINLMKKTFAVRNYINSMGTGLVSSNSSGETMPNDFEILSQSYANFIQNDENKSKMRWFANMCSLFKPVPNLFKTQGGAVSDILCVMALLCGFKGSEIKTQEDTERVVDEMVRFETCPGGYLPLFANVKNIAVYMDGEPDDWTMAELLLRYFGDRLRKITCFTRISENSDGANLVAYDAIMQYFRKVFIRHDRRCEIVTDRDQENIDKVVEIFKSDEMRVLINRL